MPRTRQFLFRVRSATGSRVLFPAVHPGGNSLPRSGSSRTTGRLPGLQTSERRQLVNPGLVPAQRGDLRVRPRRGVVRRTAVLNPRAAIHQREELARRIVHRDARMMRMPDHRHIQTSCRTSGWPRRTSAAPRSGRAASPGTGRAFHLHVPILPVVVRSLPPLAGRRRSLILNEILGTSCRPRLRSTGASSPDRPCPPSSALNRNSTRFCNSSGSFSTQSKTSPCSSITEGASTIGPLPRVEIRESDTDRSRDCPAGTVRSGPASRSAFKRLA